MRFLTNSLAKKMWLTVTAAILITILYSYFLSYLFYEKIYVENVENSLLAEGKRLAMEYGGGPLEDDLREKIDWYNSKSETEIFIVSNPRELSACLPFEIDYQTLIGQAEREELLKGNAVQKLGYEERFDRKIMGVIIPLLDEDRLQGIIYLYLPLAKISEITQGFAYLWFIAATIFTVVSIVFGTMLIKKLTKPLLDMKNAAEHVSQGQYGVHLAIDSKDEIGQLAYAFNHMSSSIQKEDERKRDFLANVSHELRTPISYVKGYSDALMSDMVQSDEERNNYLRLIHREAGRMERLVGDLLDLSKLESDEYKLEKMPLPLAQLIEDAIEKYEPFIQEKGLELQYDLDPDIIINGDEGRIEQVIQNIMDNSLRYTEKGEISIRLFRMKEKCWIEIEDTGIGIPEGHLNKIKQRFYRVNKGRTRSDGGTGLGLAIAEKLVKLHQGDLIVLSEVNKGTTVRIILPMLLLVFGLSACGDNNAVEEEPQFLEVELSINPEKAEVNEPVVFEAKVTYGEEEVTDADEVKFEIWRANDEEHEKILVEHAEKGIYRLEKSFAVEGTYYIYSHVTARRMHNMPKKEFIIGQPSEPEEDSSGSEMKDKEGSEDTEEHSSH